jgi:hypothetical protein
VKRYEKYGRKVGWIVKWYGKCERKVSWNVKWYGKYDKEDIKQTIIDNIDKIDKRKNSHWKVKWTRTTWV